MLLLFRGKHLTGQELITGGDMNNSLFYPVLIINYHVRLWIRMSCCGGKEVEKTALQQQMKGYFPPISHPKAIFSLLLLILTNMIKKPLLRPRAGRQMQWREEMGFREYALGCVCGCVQVSAITITQLLRCCAEMMEQMGVCVCEECVGVEKVQNEKDNDDLLIHWHRFLRCFCSL